ncbi:MAG: DNA mismatch repair protein [Trizodia sp. TS-e1964]|nr:MAG: DNA mismatch repair protein [Trizodia sp. TS-e1964]
MASPSPPIAPLAADLVAQLKSSAEITSLNTVVLGLVQNSLDARAQRLDIIVDFRRGGCIVEDDGSGISLEEFREDGGLGRLHHTSKYGSVQETYGCSGRFLASIAALAILSVTSRHMSNSQANSLTLHHSKFISRLIPAPAHHALIYREHGTRIVVRDLFGNMPVRVKQRAIAAKFNAETEREWELLKHSIVALILAWGSGVNLTLTNTAKNRKFCIRNIVSSRVSSFAHRTQGAAVDPTFLKRMLTIAGYIVVADWNSWISTSISTPSFSIQGAISTIPAPSKQIQFISLGIRPFSNSDGFNVLYQEVNRVFAASEFGRIENDSNFADFTDITQRSLIKKQLRTKRKGVDKWPMFYLRIDWNNKSLSSPKENELLQNAKDLEAVLEMLRIMLSEFLKENGFLVRRNEASSEDDFEEPAENVMAPKKIPNMKAKSPFGGPVRGGSGFSEWSRVKAGQHRLHSGDKKMAVSLLASPKASASLPQPSTPKRSRNTPPLPIDSQPASCLASITGRGPNGTGLQSDDMEFPMSARTPDVMERLSENSQSDCNESHGFPDRVVSWKNPRNQATYQVNSRTGFIVSSPKTSGSNSSFCSPTKLIKKAKFGSMNSKDKVPSEWLGSILKDWRNPAFATAEKFIIQISPEMAQSDLGLSCHSHSCVFNFKSWNDPTSSKANKLSKEGLRTAEFIAQVDRKYLLVMINSESSKSTLATDRMLVIIDQHAADERCRVESLLAELCAIPTEASSDLELKSGINTCLLFQPITFEVTFSESRLFKLHVKHFANWGILYDVSKPGKEDQLNQGVSKVSKITVKTLPSIISERCCADVGLLIDLMRKEIWAKDECRLASRSKAADIKTQGSSGTASSECLWLRRIADCPQGILDMVNSRACRGAIMFNDKLTPSECQSLLERLAKCYFPFQCAHGRPSMIPLLDIASISPPSEKASLDESFAGFGALGSPQKERNPAGFIGAFQSWKDSGFADSPFSAYAVS